MILSTLCYLEKDDSYLMLHRVKRENDANKDKWIGIGGKFEAGESPDDRLIREVREEIGVTLNSYRFRGIITFTSEVWETEYMHLFTSDDFEGEISECSEGIPKWVKKNQINTLPIWEGDKIFFELLAKDVEFFSLKLSYDKNERLTSAILNGKSIM